MSVVTTSLKRKPGQSSPAVAEGPLSAEQVVQLLEAPPANHPLGLRDRAMLETMYSAGLRVSELVGLDIERWDAANQVWDVVARDVQYY